MISNDSYYTATNTNEHRDPGDSNHEHPVQAEHGADADYGTRAERGAPEESWDHKRTAAELGVTPETLYVWVNSGSGPPAERHGRRRRYRPSEVRAYRRALAERFP